jgi:predicted TPR repeat methyltransferase
VNRQQRRAAAKGGVPSANAPIALAATTTPAGNTAERFAVAHKHHQAGQLAQAEAIYRQILTIDPRHAGSLHLLGGIAFQTGNYEAAIDLIRKAIALNRRIPAFHCDLGTALQHQGKSDEAAKSYRQALALKPDYAEALNNLGNVLTAQGKLDDASKAYRRALALKPDYAEAHYNLGELLTRRWPVIAELSTSSRTTPNHSTPSGSPILGGASWPRRQFAIARPSTSNQIFRRRISITASPFCWKESFAMGGRNSSGAGEVRRFDDGILLIGNGTAAI